MNARFRFVYVVIIELISVITYAQRLTEQEKNKLLEQHNKFRQMAMDGNIPGQPKAKSMSMLRWSEDLADKAKRWSKMCPLHHDPESKRLVSPFTYVGQNIANLPNLAEAVPMWFEEHKNYNYEQNSCSGTCGHYTQIVWAATEYVGCGYTNCEDKPEYPYGLSVVCNYGEGGNMVGEKPYESSHSSAIYIPPVYIYFYSLISAVCVAKIL